jgi:hypothetical protein
MPGEHVADPRQERRSCIQPDPSRKCITSQSGDDQLNPGIDAKRLIERHDEKDQVWRIEEGDLPIIK